MDPGSTEPSPVGTVGRPGGTASRDHGGDNDVRIADEQERPVDTGLLVDLARHALRGVGVRDMQVDLTLVDDVHMATLNAAHMGADGPTDVLAFPLDAPGEGHPGVPSILGDVVIAPAVAARQAREAGHSEHDELALLVVHGVLHLLGHDHAGEDERRVMFGLTDELLADFRARADLGHVGREAVDEGGSDRGRAGRGGSGRGGAPGGGPS